MKRLVFVAISASLTGSLLAQTLVRDINQQRDLTRTHSSPTQWAPLGNKMLFAATEPHTGTELWITDGTAAGTTLVLDIEPGYTSSGPNQLVALASGVVVFVASQGTTPWELWRSDGTAAGTVLVKDILPGAATSGILGITAVGNTAYFIADDGVSGTELWKTDGTAAGTVLVNDTLPGRSGISNGANQIAPVGNGVVFTVGNAGWSVWFSDGSAAGTYFVKQVSQSMLAAPRYLTSLGGAAVFFDTSGSPDQLWGTDGTSAGTVPLGVGASFGTPIVVDGGRAYLSAGVPTTELWVTNGTSAGTRQVVDLNGDLSSLPVPLGALANGEIVFTAINGLTRNLYKTNGMPGGTVLLAASLTSVFGSSLAGRIGASLYFGSGSVDTELWKTDGTIAGTGLVKDIWPGQQASFPGQFAALAGRLLFVADDGVTGGEPWITDGTTAGTQRVADINPPKTSLSSGLSVLGVFDDRAYLAATDGVTASQLWVSDGTGAGTQLFVNLRADGFPDANSFAATDDFFFMFANDGVNGKEPWVSDGTAAGTYLLADLYPGPLGSAYLDEAVRLGNQVLFAANDGQTGAELWITDGSAPGTRMVADLYPGSGSGPTAMVSFQRRVVFAAGDASGPAVWITDGTAAGTTKLGGLRTPFPYAWVELGGYLYFVADDGVRGYELWRTDGTPAGTSLVIDLRPSGSSGATHLRRTGARLLFYADDGSGPAFWISDGTAAGTRLGARAPRLSGYGAQLDSLRTLFWVDDGITPNNLWVTDGTPAGTTFVKTLGPRSSLSSILNAAHPGATRVLLAADDGVGGYEPWVTDGTAAGTFKVGDIGAGKPVGASWPQGFVRVGPRVLFAADDGATGYELHAFDLAALGDYAAQPYGAGCPGSGGLIPTIALIGEPRASSPLPFGILLQSARPSSLAVLLASLTPGHSVLGGGCRLWVGAPFVALPLTTDAAGNALLVVPITPAIVGQRFDLQWAVADPQGAYLGAASTSGGLELIGGL